MHNSMPDQAPICKTMKVIARVASYHAAIRVALLLLFSSSLNRVKGQSLLEKRWNISGPVFGYRDLQFDLGFTVSDFIQDSMVEYRLYDGHNCKDGGNSVNRTGDADITDNDYLLSRIRPDLKPVGNGTGTREIKVTLNIVPDKVQNSTIFEDDVDRGLIMFCVRLSVYNLNTTNPQAVEVNFIEVPVILTVSLTDRFSLSLFFNNSELVVQSAYDDTAVEAYLCDNDNNVVEFDSREQGLTVRVCIVPTDASISEGAFLRHLEEFTFWKGDDKQVAIAPKTGGQAADELTVVSCYPGALICAFETLLGSSFFNGVGVVFGTGSAFLQIGRESSGEQAARGRKLEETAGDAGKTPNDMLLDRPTGFQVQIIAVPSADCPGNRQEPSSVSTLQAITPLLVTLLSVGVWLY